MQNIIVACVQPRMHVFTTPEEFETEARRFLRQAQAKAAQLVIFPELTGVMLAPGMISGFKKGFIKRADQGRRPEAGFWARRLGRVAGSTGGAVGGGFRGSMTRLLRKKSDELRDVYFETFGNLAGRGAEWQYLAERWRNFAPASEQWIMWDLALIQAIMNPDMVTEKQVNTPPENTKRRVFVYTWLNPDKMQKDFWNIVNNNKN